MNGDQLFAALLLAFLVGFLTGVLGLYQAHHRACVLRRSNKRIMNLYFIIVEDDD